jgi:imidazolonepropionase-like amidohydrolase
MKVHPSYIFLLQLVALVNLHAQDLTITGGWLVDVSQAEIKPNPGINIKSGKIVGFGTSNGEMVKTIALDADDYILPGLIDLHAHYRVAHQGIAKDDTVVMSRLFLANGITATFPAGEVEPVKMRHLSGRIASGEVPGPRILHSGPYFGAAAPDWDPNNSVEDVNRMVDYWAGLGVKGFKAKGITPVHLEALIKRAHLHGLTVTAHLNSGVRGSVNPSQAIDMGIDRIEHFLGGELLSDTAHAYVSLALLDPDDPKLDEIIAKYVNHKVYFDATVATYGAIGLVNEAPFEMWAPEEAYLTPYVQELIASYSRSDFSKLCEDIYYVKKQVVKRFYDAGGLITIGSDRPLLVDNYLGTGLGGFFIHREMQVLVDSGIDPLEVIKMATLQNAQAIGMSDKLGSIDVSKWADLAIIKGNPEYDITNTRNVHLVVVAGRVFHSESLLNYCMGKLGPTSAESWLRER